MKKYLVVLLVASCFGSRQESTIAALKKQNILWTSQDGPVGLYNQDISNGLFLGAFIAADMVLYNKLMKLTINKTMQAITKDLDHFISVLENTQASEERFEERMAFAAYQGDTTMSVSKKKQLIYTKLRRYVLDHHTLGSVLQRQILSALAMRWGWDRVTSWLESELMVPAPSLLVRALGLTWQPEVLKTFETAYQYEGDQVVPLKRAPMSLTMAYQLGAFLVSPFMTMRASMRMGQTSFSLDRMGWVNRLLGTGLSEKLFSQGVKTLLEGIELAGAVSFFEQRNKITWTKYVVEHHTELLRLLTAYRNVLEDPRGKEAHVHLMYQELKDFVEEGYRSTSTISGASLRDWWSSQYQSTNNVGSWLRNATLALFVVKSAYWLYDSIREN